MKEFYNLFCHDFRRRLKDSFLIGYNIIFPIIMIGLIGYLSSENYGNTFTGYHYYSIVMLPFCIAMVVITAAFAAKEEAYKKTAVRFLFAPISMTHIVLSKLLSITIVVCICNLLVLAFAWLVFGLPIVAQIFPLIIILASETFAVSAIGLFIGFGMRNFIIIKNLLNIPIIIAAILGGVFFPIGTFNHGWQLIIKLSPLTWINRGEFLCIYDNNNILLWKIAMITTAVGIIFTILAVILFKKEEFIHGNLPGYDK